MKTFRTIVAGLMAFTQAACYGPARQYDLRSDLAVAEGRIVRVTLNDGTSFRLSAPRVVLDSLLTGWSVPDGKAVGYPLSTVRSVTGRQRSPARTGILAAAVVGGLLATILIAGGGGGQEEPNMMEDED